MLPNWYTKYKDFIEGCIQQELDSYFEKNNRNSQALQDFEEVIRYSLQGGKKIRAILALEFYLLLSHKKLKDIDKNDDIVKVCLAIEMTHSWTLLQDDLPCMDNDTLRRWQSTVWHKFGEYKAVLASDILQTHAFELLSTVSCPSKAISLIKTLSKSSGFYWVIGGQVEDIYFEKNPLELTQAKLLSVHRKKTAKLIKASVKMGIICSWNTKYLKPFSAFWEKLGLAFQIKDDIMDVEGSIEEVWKSVWRGEQKWFVFFEGLKKSKKKLKELLDSCLKISKTLESEKLQFVTEYVGKRKS